jgi:hypothetical protein
MRNILILSLLATALPPPHGMASELEVTSLGRLEPGLPAHEERSGGEKKWRRVKDHLSLDERRVVARQLGGSLGGNTSVRNAWPLVWKEKGYFQRARDLGQVFTAEKDFTLDAIILRTGNAHLAFLDGMPGAPLFVQFFEVTGTPVIDDNGTPVGSKATHGFSTNHRCDDYVRDVQYRSLHVAGGGVMPDLTGAGGGKLVYMKWDLLGKAELPFKAGRRYAFMVGIAEPGRERGFTLCNRNNAGSPKPPSMTLDDTYHGGWGLRREGNGEKPLQVPGKEPPGDPATREKLEMQSAFAKGGARYALSPTCDGYPDVDTYRDLEFYLIAHPLK